MQFARFMTVFTTPQETYKSGLQMTLQNAHSCCQYMYVRIVRGIDRVTLRLPKGSAECYKRPNSNRI